MPVSPTVKWRVVALLGVCAALAATAISPKSLIASQLSLFLVLLVLIIPVHELGHAVAGVFVGFRVISVVVGTGPPLAAFSFLGVTVRINLLPLGGMTMALPNHPYASMRFRKWVLTAGGPLANVLIYVVLRRIFGPALDDSEHHPLLASARSVNWTVLGMNLIPFRTAEGQSSDGYGLFTIPFWSQKQLDEALLAAYSVRGQDALTRGDIAGARRVADEVRARFPDATLSYNLHGFLLLRDRRHDDALFVWREGLAKASDPKRAALLKNNIAYAELLRGRDEDLPEADRLSDEALAVLHDLPAVSGTRGAVLLRLGRAAEALPLLQVGEAGATDARARAYNAASMASGLAALGRHDEAVRKLEEARRAQAECELIPRAEADIVAGPLPAPPPVPPTLAAAMAVEPAAHAARLRRWRRDARILAFAAIFVLAERLGLEMVLGVTAIVMSCAPDLSGAYALAGYGFAAALLYFVGLGGSHRFVLQAAGRAESTLLALAMATAAWWLVLRHRRIGPPLRSRTPAVLGWIMFSLLLLTVIPDLVHLSWDHSPLALHGAARSLVGEVPALIGMAVFLATRSRRDARQMVVFPVIVALAVVVPASTWYRDRFALGDLPEQGPRLEIAAPVAARVVRSARIAGPSDAPALSPGARAFVVKDVEARGWLRNLHKTRQLLHVGDFDGRLVDVDGVAAAFMDDERLIVLRAGADPKSPALLAEVRPFHGPDPVWTKPIVDLDVRTMGIRVDRAAGTIFIVPTETVDDGATLIWKTTAAPDTKVEAGPLQQRKGDRFIGAATRARDWGGILVSRRQDKSRELFWRAAAGERRISSQSLRLECAEAPAEATQVWCLTNEVPILFRIDIDRPEAIRVRGEIGGGEMKMLGESVLATCPGGEIQLVNLKTWRGTRLTLPEAARQKRVHLADGGLATVERSLRDDATLVVYELPADYR